jgi:hypothetical protein
MRDGAERRPGAVPDEGPDDAGLGVDGMDVRGGADTDGDGRPDTLLTTHGADLFVLTDLDGDGLADRVLRIGPDGVVHAAYHDHPGHPGTVAADEPVAGHAPAAPGPWGALLGRLLGLGP